MKILYQIEGGGCELARRGQPATNGLRKQAAEIETSWHSYFVLMITFNDFIQAAVRTLESCYM